MFEKVHELIGGHHGTVLFGFRCAGAEVRHGDHIRSAEQGGDGEIGDKTVELAAVEGGDHCRGVDDLLAGKVEQHGARLEAAQGVRIDHVARGRQRRDMQGHIVGARQQALQAVHFLDAAGQPPGGFHGQRGVVTDHLHAQFQRHVGDDGADRPEADHAQGAALDLAAGKAALFLLQQGGHGGILGDVGQPLYVVHAGEDVARGQQHAGEHQLLDRIGVGARGVEHHHAARAVFGDRDVVDARPGTGDAEQGVGDRLAVELVAAQDVALRSLGVRPDLIAVARKAVESLAGNLVVGANPEHRSPLGSGRRPGRRGRVRISPGCFHGPRRARASGLPGLRSPRWRRTRCAGPPERPGRRRCRRPRPRFRAVWPCA